MYRLKCYVRIKVYFDQPGAVKFYPPASEQCMAHDEQCMDLWLWLPWNYLFTTVESLI